MKSEYLLTKDQAVAVLESWGNKEPMPRKDRQLIICLPKPANPNMATVSKTDLKSTYGRPLYRVIMGMDYEIFSNLA